ncbi:MAG: flagellar basal body P-ring protein FlgI [Planctomycetales bacterium]|nr:flagellar basal body P-ring protein FlgI [Planctomycetales bacterium]
MRNAECGLCERRWISIGCRWALPVVMALAVGSLPFGSASGAAAKAKVKAADDEDDPPKEAQKTSFVGDYIRISGMHAIAIEGVGLVSGLNGTGGDTAPSRYRTMLVDEMQKNGVKHPNTILRDSPNYALVLIRAALPPVVRRGDTFDVEVVLPENTSATSLNGGYLLPSRLAEQAFLPGKGVTKGHEFAIAKGPLLLSLQESGSVTQAAGQRRAKILGGGAFLGDGLNHKDRNLTIYLLNEFRDVRNTKRVAERIGQRFHHYEHGIKQAMATAHTDQKVELKVHPRYRSNYLRYVEVIRRIAFKENAVEERMRMEKLKVSLLIPTQASDSALQLEAIGTSTIPILKEGLKSRSAEVRFYSADALAYLGDDSGAKELGEAAKNEPAFRVFALAALADLNEAVSNTVLRDLMNTNSAELRYGAFRSLWTMDKADPFLRGERINDQFNLHVLRTEGDPLVHLTRHRVPEVVLFGPDQELQTPVALSAGRHIVVSAPQGSDIITVSRFEPNQPDQKKATSRRVGDVIRAIGELGASYPDAAQMLTQAERQGNLNSRLEIDALPQAGRVYYRPPEDIPNQVSTEKTKVRVGKASMLPNLFPSVKDDKPVDDADGTDSPDANEASRRSSKDKDTAGQASVADETEETTKSASRFKDWFKNPFKRPGAGLPPQSE